MTPMLIQRRAARLVAISWGVPEPLKLVSGNYRHYVSLNPPLNHDY